MTNRKFIIISVLFLVVSAVAIVFATTTSTKVPLVDGEWAGQAEGRNGTIQLVLVVKDGKIAEGRVVSESETVFAKPAEEEIIAQAVKLNSVEGLDVVSGATVTSKAMMEALKDAYQKALEK